MFPFSSDQAGWFRLIHLYVGQIWVKKNQPFNKQDRFRLDTELFMYGSKPFPDRTLPPLRRVNSI